MENKSLYVELKALEQKLQESHQKELLITQKIKEAINPAEIIVKSELKKIFQNI